MGKSIEVIIGVASKVLPLLFFWKVGKDHEKSKQKKTTRKLIDKLRNARK